MAEPEIIAGLVVYQETANGLEGHWIHASTGGQTAREIVTGATLENPVGKWPVTIFKPDKEPLFSGELTIETLGESLSLAWQGTPVGAGPSSFTGVGRVLKEGLLAATFEPEQTHKAG